PARQEIDSGSFVSERGALRGDDLEISHQSTLVTVRGKRQRVLGGLDSLTLLGTFLIENAQSREVIFHLLEGGEDILSIGCYVGIVSCSAQFWTGGAATRRERRLREHWIRVKKV